MIKKCLLMIMAFFASATFAFAEVNINTASEQELQTINGIGQAKARAIVEYRTSHGPFKSVEDLKNVRGIGRGVTYERIAPQVTVGGTTAARSQAATPAVKPAATPATPARNNGNTGAARSTTNTNK